MSWLGDWLKQVVLIIMLAAFVDLLLPNQAMQRYVKLVVSLFLLLTLMNPIFQLFRRDWNVDQLVAEASRMQTTAAEGTKTVSLDGILTNGEKLREDQAQDARKLTEERMAADMRKQLENDMGESIRTLQVSLALDNQGNPSISGVRIVLSHREEKAVGSGRKEEGSAAGLVQPVQVEEVKPVAIDVRVNDDDSVPVSAAAARQDAAGRRTSQGDAARMTAVTEELQKDWGIPPKRVDVQVEP